MSFLPPPPNVPNQTSSQLPNAPTETERGALPSLTPPRPNGNSGQQQQFTIPTKPDPELVERQRRLEEEAAIALQPVLITQTGVKFTLMPICSSHGNCAITMAVAIVTVIVARIIRITALPHPAPTHRPQAKRRPAIQRQSIVA